MRDVGIWPPCSRHDSLHGRNQVPRKTFTITAILKVQGQSKGYHLLTSVGMHVCACGTCVCVCVYVCLFGASVICVWVCVFVVWV